METDETASPILEALRALVGREVQAHDRLADLGFEGLHRVELYERLERETGLRVHAGIGPEPETVQDLAAHAWPRGRWRFHSAQRLEATDVAGADFWQLAFRPPIQLLQRLILHSLFRLRVAGRSRVPRSGPFVAVANHQSHLDVPTVEAGLPLGHVNRTHPLAAMDYFFERPGLGPVVHLGVNALPVNRRATTAQAMKAGIDLLSAGRRLIVFPEGTRSVDGAQGPFKQGVGYLLAGRPWPAVPMHIAGAHAALPKGKAVPRLARLRLTIGEPVSYQDTPSTTDGWRAVASDLERRVKGLGDSAGSP